mgnify:CR=1 FL=1
MDKYIYNEKNGLWYELQGDYYLPCLKLPEERTAYIGIIAAPHGVLAVFIQLQVIAVVLHLHHRVVHLRTGNIQPCHGIGILRSGFRQLCLSTEGITSPAGVADG